MQKYERDFKGVWIPKQIWLSEELSLIEKVLFAEIESLDNEKGCWASNRYFADFFGVSTRQISTHVTSLKQKGFITVRVQDRNQRTIRCAGKWKRLSEKKKDKLAEMRQDIAAQLGIARSSNGVGRNLPRG